MYKHSKSNQCHSLCVNKSSQFESDQKSKFFKFYRDARFVALNHPRTKTRRLRGFRAIFLLKNL